MTVLLAAWSIGVGLPGLNRGSHALLESSRRAALILPALLTLAVLSLVTGLLRRDFNIAFVANHSSRNLNPVFTAFAITAAWNGMLLLAAWVFAILFLPLASRARDGRSGATRASAAVSAVLLPVAGVLLAVDNPFTRLGITPLEGKGLDPASLDAALPLLAPLGLIACAMLGRALLDRILALPGEAGRSVDSVERWFVGSWVLLTVAMMAGLWHAYQTSGADGSWRWPSAQRFFGVIWFAASMWLSARALARTVRGKKGHSRSGATVTAAVTLLAVATIGSRLGPERDLLLKSGGATLVSSWVGTPYLVTHMGVSRFEASDRYTTAATLDLVRGERPVGLVTSERRQYFDVLGRRTGEPVIRAGIKRGLLEDLRVVFREPSASEQAAYRVRVYPLMSCLWLAGGLLVIGGLLRLLELANE
ncbi:MAG: hypothetical protein HY700_03405 [Gemmatimonadetes bacterium]|nr:hypothetical protein [Gemmatimonadota bacterium]